MMKSEDTLEFINFTEKSHEAFDEDSMTTMTSYDSLESLLNVSVNTNKALNVNNVNEYGNQGELMIIKEEPLSNDFVTSLTSDDGNQAEFLLIKEEPLSNEYLVMSPSSEDGNDAELQLTEDKAVSNEDFVISSRSEDIFHMKERPFVCDICPESFSRKSKLAIHSRQHTVQRLYGCYSCRIFFETKSELQSHGRLLHNQICNVCKEEFVNSIDFIHHMQVCTKQNDHESTYTREKPDIEIAKETTVVIQDSEKQFVCRFCQKSLSSASSLKFHYRVHTGERPHVCDFCQKGFVKKNDLERHKWRMHIIHKHICIVCKEEFTEKTDLKRHVQTHSNEKKSNIWEICKYRLLNKIHLKKRLPRVC